MSTHLTSGIILMVALGTAVVTVSITQLSPQFSYGTIALQGPERRVAVALFNLASNGTISVIA